MVEKIQDAAGWLLKNRELRMDANSPIFRDDERRVFLERYEFATKYCAGKRVLDGACGTGYGSSVLGRVASSVVGIDCSDEAVAYATQTYGAPNLSFRKSFVELTPFDPDSFDTVVSFETVEHTLCPRAHMMEIARLLRPGAGHAVLSIPNSWGFTDHHFFDFNLPLLKEISGEFFSTSEFFYQNVGSSSAPAGIRPLSNGDVKAHCILAVCAGPRKEKVVGDRIQFIMNEIYANSFARHLDFLTLMYRQNTSISQRAINWLRARLKA